MESMHAAELKQVRSGYAGLRQRTTRGPAQETTRGPPQETDRGPAQETDREEAPQRGPLENGTTRRGEIRPRGQGHPGPHSRRGPTGEAPGVRRDTWSGWAAPPSWSELRGSLSDSQAGSDTKLTLEDLFKAEFVVHDPEAKWINDSEVIYRTQEGHINFNMAKYSISPDLKYVLFAYDVKQ
ncbi:hypothetical protein CRUP_002392, partial [Coryphaenoides rupestris]